MWIEGGVEIGWEQVSLGSESVVTCLLFVPWEPAGPGLGVSLPLKGGSCTQSVCDGHSRLTETP